MGRDDELAAQLLREYGPLLGGPALTRALGFRTGAALKKALRSEHLRLKIFHIEGRRGLFCLTTDVAAWLGQVSDVGEKAAPSGAARREE